MIKVFVYATVHIGFLGDVKQEYKIHAELRGITRILVSPTLVLLAKALQEEISEDPRINGPLAETNEDLGLNFYPPYEVIIETPQGKIRTLKGRPLSREEIQEFLRSFRKFKKREFKE